MARTAAHRVNNALVPLAGYAQLLAQHPSIQADPRLARFATAAHAGAQQAAVEIARLQRIVRLEEERTVVLGPPILDLDRSTAPEEAETAETMEERAAPVRQVLSGGPAG